MPDEILQLEPSEVNAARIALDKIPEYHWLTQGPEFFRTSDIYKRLGVNVKVVINWCEHGTRTMLPLRRYGATPFGDQLGWRIPRSALLVFFYRVITGADALDTDH